MDNSKIIFLISQKKKVCYEPSVEPSGQDTASQHMFIEKYGKLSFNYLCYPFLLSEALIKSVNIHYS